MYNKSLRRFSRQCSLQESKRFSLAVPDPLTIEIKKTIFVESILVSTGVYNPNNDLMVHLRKLFQTSKVENDAPVNKSEKCLSTVPVINIDTSFQTEIDKTELKRALSRKNSFISYFDDAENIPDLTVDTLKDAVSHIINSSHKYI